MFAAKLLVYLPGGAAQGELPKPISWQASVAHNDVGALTVDYSTLVAGGEWIARDVDDGLEVAMEIWNGLGNWVEARGCRFVRVKQNEVDRADGAKVFRVTFVSYGWLLKKARLLGGSFVAGQRKFMAPKVGPLMASIMVENAGRDGIGDVTTVVGGGANDAAGAAWPTLPDQTFKYGTDYFSIVRGLQEGGAIDWATQARGLYLYLPDSTTLSPDLSTTVQLRAGYDITEAPAETTIEDMIGSLAVSADAGGTTVVTDPAAPKPHGNWEGHLSVGQVSGEPAAISMGEAELDRLAHAREQYTYTLVMRDGAKIPMIDYWPGCWITAPTKVDAEKTRVHQITVSFGKEGYAVNVVLNDRFTEADIRRARTLNALSTGQVGAGGAPPPVSTDPEASRIPKTPTDLDATTALVFEPISGLPKGVLTTTWTPVTEATDDGPLTISGYDFQYRVGTGDWQNSFTPEVSVEITGLNPGDAGETRVRAVGARTTFPSPWSATDAFVVSGDTTPPSVPSAPLAAAHLGVVTIAWDGTTNIGTAMEEDFARIQVAMGTTVTPTTVIGTMARAGFLPVTDRVIGEELYIRFRSEDTSGNVSAWSDVSDPVTVVGVQEPDLEAGSVTANAIQAGTLTGDLFAALMVIASMYTTSADGTGKRVEWDSAGIRLYNALEELWVNLPTGAGENPSFRGEIQADGLTVRGGASFYSTLNEFAPDSVIALADKVTAPVAAPTVSNFWASTQFQITAKTGDLGTFALDPSLIQSATWNNSVSLIHLVQKAPSGAGTRLWYYNPTGTYNTHWDLPAGWDVTSVGVGTDGQFRILYKWSGDWYIWDYSRPSGSQDRLYTPINAARRPILTMDGNDIWVAETNSSGTLIIRRCSTALPNVGILETVTTSGVSDQSLDPNFLYRGSADFGTARFAAGYRNTFTTRVYGTTGVYDGTRNFPPPATRAGAYWNPNNSRFYTVGTDGRLYSHSAMHWTDPALDTWHLAQTFRDSNATGGTHETVIGGIRTFNPAKRSWVRVLAAQVPYAGGVDDPNQWRLYGKTGTVPPAIGTGMTLQYTAAYTSLQTDIATLISVGGSAPPAVSNFPNATPARVRSARTFPSDSTKSILEMRGDGSGWWGDFSVTDQGVADLKVGAFLEHYRSTTQATASGVDTTIFMSDVVEATGVTYAGGVFTIQRAGVYDISAQVTYAGGTGGRRLTRVYVNGAEVARSEGAGPATGQVSVPVSKTLRLAVGNTIEVVALSSVTGTSSVAGRGATYITITRQGS